MFLLTKLITLFTIFKIFLQQTYYYPEDYTVYDQLSYSSSEKHLSSYYFYDPNQSNTNTYLYDFRNGIRVNMFNSVIKNTK